MFKQRRYTQNKLSVSYSELLEIAALYSLHLKQPEKQKVF